MWVEELGWSLRWDVSTHLQLGVHVWLWWCLLLGEMLNGEACCPANLFGSCNITGSWAFAWAKQDHLEHKLVWLLRRLVVTEAQHQFGWERWHLKAKPKQKPSDPMVLGVLWLLDVGHQSILWVAHRGTFVSPKLTVNMNVAWENPSWRLCRCHCQPANMDRP